MLSLVRFGFCLLFFCAAVAAWAQGKEQFEFHLHDPFGKPVAGAVVDLGACGQGSLQTNAEGIAYFSLPAGSNCYLKAHKPGLSEVVAAVKSGQPKISVTTGNDRSAVFDGRVYDAQTGWPLSGVVVHARSLTGVHFNMTQTNNRGQYSLRLDPRNEYLITYALDGYSDGNYTYQTAREPLSGATLPNANLTRGTSEFMAWLATHPGGIPPRARVEPWTAGALNGFCIQLASGPANFASDASRYADLTEYGKLYAKPDGERFKLRLGIFASREEAQQIVDRIAVQYPGVFATEETGAAEKLRWKASASAPVTYAQPGAPAPVQYAAVAPAPVPQPSPQSVRLIARNTPPTQPGTTAKGALTSPSATTGVQYAVEVAAFSTGQARPLSDYAALSDIGRQYAMMDNGVVRIRIGGWSDFAQADQAKNLAIARGFREASVVTEPSGQTPANTLPHLAYSPPATYSPLTPKPATVQSPQPAPVKKPAPASPTGPQYLIRVAALSNPDRFNPEPYRDLGVIEMRPLGNGMTLVVISGFRNAREALIAEDELRARGLKEPFAVKEEKGKMERLR